MASSSPRTLPGQSWRRSGSAARGVRPETARPIRFADAAANRPLPIIAEDVGGDAPATLVIHPLRGTLEVCAVRAPGFGARRLEMLSDIAVLTGGQSITADLGPKLGALMLDELVDASTVTIDTDTTTITGGSRRRRGRPGSRTRSTPPAQRSRRASCRGGGVALLRALPALEALSLTGDQQLGVGIIRRASEAPLHQMAENAGGEGAMVIDRVRRGAGLVGHDVASMQYEDLLDAGIAVPVMAIRVALQNAASVAALIPRTEALIA